MHFMPYTMFSMPIHCIEIEKLGSISFLDSASFYPTQPQIEVENEKHLSDFSIMKKVIRRCITHRSNITTTSETFFCYCTGHMSESFIPIFYTPKGGQLPQIYTQHLNMSQ